MSKNVEKCQKSFELLRDCKKPCFDKCNESMDMIKGIASNLLKSSKIDNIDDKFKMDFTLTDKAKICETACTNNCNLTCESNGFNLQLLSETLTSVARDKFKLKIKECEEDGKQGLNIGGVCIIGKKKQREAIEKSIKELKEGKKD